MLHNLILFDSRTVYSSSVEPIERGMSRVRDGGEDGMSGFVVEDNGKELRMGSKAGWNWF